MTRNGQADLSAVLDGTRHVLLDFDGPICSVFAGLPAATVAARLRGLLQANGVALPTPVVDEADPIEILRFASTRAPALARRIEAALGDAELAASYTAEPTPYASAVLDACRRAGRPVAVVSNNAEPAVRSYLERHRLLGYVGLIAGRQGPDPALLKPSPHLVVGALRALGADPATCVLVGDSSSDIASARAAAVRSVGYANKPGKRQQLATAGADAVITTMADLVPALSGSAVQAP